MGCHTMLRRRCAQRKTFNFSSMAIPTSRTCTLHQEDQLVSCRLFAHDPFDSVRELVSQVFGPESADTAACIVYNVLKENSDIFYSGQAVGKSTFMNILVPTNDAFTFADEAVTDMSFQYVKFMKLFYGGNIPTSLALPPVHPHPVISMKDHLTLDTALGDCGRFEDEDSLAGKCESRIIIFGDQKNPMQQQGGLYNDYFTACIDEKGNSEQDSESEEEDDELDAKPIAFPEHLFREPLSDPFGCFDSEMTARVLKEAQEAHLMFPGIFNFGQGGPHP